MSGLNDSAQSNVQVFSIPHLIHTKCIFFPFFGSDLLTRKQKSHSPEDLIAGHSSSFIKSITRQAVRRQIINTVIIINCVIDNVRVTHYKYRE